MLLPQRILTLRLQRLLQDQPGTDFTRSPWPSAFVAVPSVSRRRDSRVRIDVGSLFDMGRSWTRAGLLPTP